MAIIAATHKNKTVADPNSAYESMKSLWLRNRAVCGGERFVKEYDGLIDVLRFSNLLIPFSPSMSQQQYDFFKAEAELPGLVSLYSKFVVGGLLRKQPHLEFSEKVPEEAKKWILDEFSRDGLPMTAFLNEALSEEIQTARAWVFIDYPKVANADALTREEFKQLRPYPVLWKAESVINWRTATNPLTGKVILDRVIVRFYEEDYAENEFHPKLLDTVYVHELYEGKYRVRKFQDASETKAPYVVNGEVQKDFSAGNSPKFEEVEVIGNILFNGERLDFIPAWPLNGRIEIDEPFITALVDREISLYNKVSRRNHLLYGASTYTPVISADITDEQFEDIVNGGLGTWIKLNKGDTASVLETPTQALQDMEKAIAATVEEMAKMGIRMLSPETSESGIALEIRNASQTATLGLLNTETSNTLTAIIAFMVNWRYDLDITTDDVNFTLSADFNPAPLGEQWLRLVTEWYENGLIPRSVWLQILKQNDIVPPDYNDEEAIQEVNADEFIMPDTPGRMETNAKLQGRAQKVSQEASGMANEIINQN